MANGFDQRLTGEVMKRFSSRMALVQGKSSAVSVSGAWLPLQPIRLKRRTSVLTNLLLLPFSHLPSSEATTIQSLAGRREGTGARLIGLWRSTVANDPCATGTERSPGNAMVHLSTEEADDSGAQVTWLERVTDAEYQGK